MAQEIDVGMKCIKYMLFVTNFMFVMIGFLLISIGSSIKAIYGLFETFMADHYFSPAILTIVLGVIIFFVALFGCIGAIRESTCLINLFGLFLTLVLIMEFAAAIAAYAMRSQISVTIREKMDESMQGYCLNQYDQNAWDFTQQRLYCCGIEGPGDWKDSCYMNSTNSGIVPITCCREQGIDNDKCSDNDIFHDGCLNRLSYLVSESAFLLGCGAIAVAFIQLLGVIFACMLAKAVRRLKTQRLVDRDEDQQRTYEKLGRGQEEKQTPVLYTPTFSEA